MASRRTVGNAESAYRDAYERGIRAAAPGMTFACVGRVGSVIGPAARSHALDANREPLTGDALLAWIEAEAYAFRKATAERGQFYAGWGPWGFAKWLNERAAQSEAPVKPEKPPERRAWQRELQASSGRKIGE